MSKIKREQPNYLIIGIFMFIGILGIVMGVIVSDKLVYRLKGGYQIYLRFQELDGLTVGSKVIIGSGKPIGQVDSIDLDGPILVATILIEKKYKINKDANFQIFSTSLVGGKYISIENYTGAAPYIKPKEIIQGRDPMSLNKIIGTIGNLFSSGSQDGIGTEISGIFSSVNEVADVVKVIVQENRGNINLSISNITKSTIHLNSITANLDRKLSSISDQEFRMITDDLKRSLKNMDMFLQDINSSNSPLSLLKDPKINQSLRTIVTNVEETTQRVKAKPSLLFRS